MNNGYTVYVHTMPDGKKYVGSTSKDPKERWNYGSGYRTNVEFYRAIREAGWRNVSHEIVAEGLSKEEAAALERRLIREYWCQWPNGYNHTNGGEYPARMSDTTREKLRRAGETSAAASRRKCRCIETGAVYASVSEAARRLVTHRSAVARSCRDGVACNGYHLEYVGDRPEDPDWFRDWESWNGVL